MTPKPQENVIELTTNDNNNKQSNIINNNNNTGFINTGFINDNNCDNSNINNNNNNNNNNKDIVLYKQKSIDNNTIIAECDTKNLDFDDLLPMIGEFGKYQKILFLLMIPFAFFVAFVYFSQIFMTLVPEEHYCLVPELQHLTPNER